MKKQLFTSILLLSCINLFAGAPDLVGISKDSKCRISQSGGITTQSYVTDSGSTYELSASMADNSKMNYQLIIRNPVGSNYINKSDFITVYQGDCSKDIWSKVNYIIDPISVPSPAEPAESKDGLNTAEFCIIAGTVCLCSLALWDMCDNLTDPSPKSGPHAPPPRRHSGPTIWIDPYIGSGSSSSSSSNSSIQANNNILYNQTSIGNSDYIMAFHISSTNKYDYRVSINTGNEILDYYFMRADKKSSIGGGNYSSESKDSYSSLVVSVGIPDYTRLGGMFIYNGSPIGMYFGLNYKNDTNNNNPMGYINDHQTDKVHKSPYMPATSDTYFKFTDSGKALDNLYEINLGLDVKLTNFMWLLGGCGINLNSALRYGTIYSSSDGVNYTELTKGYVQDEYISFVPELGFNFVFDHVDIGTLVSYSQDSGFKFNMLLGVAF